MFESPWLDGWTRRSPLSKTTRVNRRRRAARRTTLLRLEQLEARTLLAAVPEGLVSWYRAEGDALDFAGDNHGTLVNATFTAGKVGQAFLFDGEDDQVFIPHDASQNTGDRFTVEAWVNLSESGHGRPIVQKRSPGNVGGYTFETTHAPNGPSNGLQFVVWVEGSQHLLQTPAGVLTNGVWHHVAATWEDGTATRIFVDGVEQATAPAVGGIDPSNAPVVIGQNVVIPSFAWHGAIDEVSFYSRALSQAEIQGVVDAGSAGKQASIVVNTAADTIDADPGVTSLREAILESNASVGVLDTISFDIASPSTDGLLSWYRGEGDASDSLGANDGTLHGGVTFAAGQVGQGFRFDGADDSVDLGGWFDLQTFSIDMWVKPGDSQTEYANIIDNAHSTSRSWVMQQNASTLNQYVWGTNDGGPGAVFDLNANEWQHVVVTRNNTTFVNDIYVNGALAATYTGTRDINYDGNQFVRLGRWAGGGRHWNGELDEVRIFDRVLSAAEVQAIAAGSRTTSSADLVSWWRSDGDASDSKGTNDGTLLNGATFAAGRNGQAFSFDGIDDRVEVPDAPNLNPTTAVTLDAWVNPQALTKTHSTVIAKSSGQRSYGMWINSDGSVHVEPSSFASSFADTSPGVVPLDTWTHVAAVITAGVGFKIYVNGVEQAITVSGSLPTLSATIAPVTIGNSDMGTHEWLFSGRIEEVGITSRALSGAEIQAIASDSHNAAGSVVHTIHVGSTLLGALPTITDPVLIDGYTQPGASPNTLADGNDAVILIELDGTSAGQASGLTIAGGGSTIRGLAINRFEGSGIVLQSSDNVVAGNFLGTDVTGTLDRGNGAEGVTVVGADETEPFYSNDFESGAGEEWNRGDLEETPADDSRFLGQFLGQFNSETVTLSLNADSIDQDITVMTVAFDLFVIRTWDGNHSVAGSGPDRFTLSLGDGTTLLDTTFSNGHPNSAAAGQAYPGAFASGQFAPRNGAAENNTLGFTHDGTGLMDSMYRLSFTFPYTGSDLVLNFTGALTSAIDDESWGLNNVKLFAGELGQAAVGNLIGGISPEAQNIVAFSGGDGIRTIGENVQVAIVGNSTFANGAQGIDLDDENIDPPEILSLTSFPAELKLTGSLDNDPSTNYRIEFFANATSDPLSFDEGQRLLGVRQVTTDAAGHAAFIHELPPVAAGEWITATATLIDGDGQTLLHTSEISAAVQALAVANVDLSVTVIDSPDPVLIGEALTYTITVTNHGPGDATGVVVTDVGSPGGVFGSATLPVGDLPNGASRSFQIVIYPSAAGTITNTASVTASEEDPNESNNTFLASTLVERIPPPVFEFAQAQYEVREGEAFAVLTVRKLGGIGSGSSGSVEFTTVNGTAGQRGIATGLSRIADFTTTSGTLFFKSRSNVATIRVPIGDDNFLEPDETFRVVLSNPSAGIELGAISSAEVIIHDNDPTLSFSAATSERKENVTGRSSLEVRLTPASNQTVTVNFAPAGGSATPGVDFSLIGSSLTFRPGETRKFIQFSNVNDTLYEGDETAFIELSSPTNAFLGTQTRHRVTIVDNDPQPPPVEPGSTPLDALFIDLQTLPRQSFRDILIRTNAFADIDTFRVQLGAGERLALDVDPSPFGGDVFSIPGIGASTLVISAPDPLNPGQFTELSRVGRSAEPETGSTTNNAATLFTAPAAGEYYVRLELPANAFAGYRLFFHRLGVSENVPSPEQLNVPGPMYAWVAGTENPAIKTVGITGPTGYGFTLTGPWLQQVTSSRRSVLSSQTLTLPAGSQFTLTSPQLGVDLPLVANGPIVVTTNSQRWGDFFGVVSTTAINFPVALGIAPINEVLADAIGSEFASVGLLSGQWRISLGASALFNNGSTKNVPVDEMLSGVPYLRQKGPINFNAQLGPISLDYSVIQTPIEWIFDPGDPMLFVKADKVGQIKEAALAVSLHGLLEYVPQDAPNPLVEAGVTQLYGHIYGNAKIPFKVGPLPLEVEAEVVLNVDADRNGELLGGLADVDEVFDVLEGDFSEVREILNDVQLGANGTLVMSITPEQEEGSTETPETYSMEAGRASVVLDGLRETIWVRGQQGGDVLSPPWLKKLNSSASIVTEGLINWDGDYLLSTTTTNSVAGITLQYNITFTNERIFASVTGSIEWSANIDYLAGTVGGKAKATITATIEFEFDDDGDVHLSGSISAEGKLTAKINGRNKKLFEGDISARVRDKDFRFDFPLGVGSKDFDIF